MATAQRRHLFNLHLAVAETDQGSEAGVAVRTRCRGKADLSTHYVNHGALPQARVQIGRGLAEALVDVNGERQQLNERGLPSVIVPVFRGRWRSHEVSSATATVRAGVKLLPVFAAELGVPPVDREPLALFR